MSRMRFQYIIIIMGAVLASVFLYAINKDFSVMNISVAMPSYSPSATLAPLPIDIFENPKPDQKIIFEPIDKYFERVIKKPFGIKISPQDSPIMPEKFSGYHTGTDFETFADEQNIDVSVYSICAGPLIVKKIASGYGGVAVQSCKIEDENVTVIYGHVRLSSVTVKINQTIDAGTQLGVLGMGHSAETGNERKHLHLGIHKGKNIALLGYVQTLQELDQWIDAGVLLKY